MQSFGRIWALLKTYNEQKSIRFANIPDLLSDLLARWKWRMNIYYEIDTLLLVHVLNPDLRFRGLNAQKITPRTKFNTLTEYFNRSYSDFSTNEVGTQLPEIILKTEFCPWVRPDLSLYASFDSDIDPFTW